MIHWKTARGRTRRQPGSMNKTEERYAAYLAARCARGEILAYWFEGMKVRLAANTFYTPDFVVQLCSGEIECHEVKGHWEDDARVKIKVAAALWPFRFVGIRGGKGGAWETEEF